MGVEREIEQGREVERGSEREKQMIRKKCNSNSNQLKMPVPLNDSNISLLEVFMDEYKLLNLP